MPGGAAADLTAEIAARLASVRSRIEQAGGDPDRVVILAVTKGQPIETCRAALGLGLTRLGENRVQEALPKLEALPEAHWDLIGHLQTNKVRQVAGRFGMIQSVDSVRLAEALAARGPQAILMEVNVAAEAAKHGFDPDRALEGASTLAELLDLRGLMGMAPGSGDPAPAFARLRRLRDEAEQRLGRELPVLSMGMSNDLEAAVRAGSTLVRLGQALFGDRHW